MGSDDARELADETQTYQNPLPFLQEYLDIGVSGNSCHHRSVGILSEEKERWHLVRQDTSFHWVSMAAAIEAYIKVTVFYSIGL